MTASGLGNRAAPLVAGEFPFTYEDFRRIAAMLHADAGIALHESKATLVYSRLAKRLRALGLESFGEYCALVAGMEGVDERQRMLAALTTNVTRFFREPHHFDHLRDTALPPLLDAAKRGGRVRIWSAGCSTGQEPYSIAMTVLSLLPNAAEHDVRILATDIDPNVIATGRRGTYSHSTLEGLPDRLRDRWMVRDQSAGESAWTVGEAARELVAFRELNLIGDWPMKGRFDIIFCRNVVIYFEESTQARIWNRFAPLLTDTGRLYIGHSERVVGCDRFESDGLTTYRLRGGR